MGRRLQGEVPGRRLFALEMKHMISRIETEFDATPYAEARDDIRALVAKPIQAWMQTPPARRRDSDFNALLVIPLDLGAAGYIVTVTQTERGWSVEATKAMQPRIKLHLAGTARSYVSALYQLADSAPDVIGRLERKARKAAEAKTSELEAA